MDVEFDVVDETHWALNTMLRMLGLENPFLRHACMWDMMIRFTITIFRGRASGYVESMRI